MPSEDVVLVTRDAELATDVRRLCAAAGQQLRLVAERADLQPLARRCSVLLVDAAATDLCEAGDVLAGGGRCQVVVLTTDPDRLDPWRAAVRVGARKVLALPADSHRLLDVLALAQETAGVPGPVVGVMGGSGGVGSTTVAGALAWAAAASGPRATLIDLDHVGGGADLLLGLERAAGLRWPDLADARGVVPAAALHERLPRVGQLAVVASGRASAAATFAPEGVPLSAVSAVVAASCRGGGAAVADLPRWPSATAEAVATACDVVVVVVGAEVRAIAAASIAVSRVAALCNDIRIVVRAGHSNGRVGAQQVAQCLGRAVVATLPYDARLAGATDRGDLPLALGRSRVGVTARQIWQQIVATRSPDLASRATDVA